MYNVTSTERGTAGVSGQFPESKGPLSYLVARLPGYNTSRNLLPVFVFRPFLDCRPRGMVFRSTTGIAFVSFVLEVYCTIDLDTVFDAILTSGQTCEKLKCLYENVMSNNIRKTAVLKKIQLVN